MTYKTTGTLKEIGAEVGDVVRSRSGNEFEVWPMAIECFAASDYTIITRANPTGPVRTVTKKEIVPGVYGTVKVVKELGGLVSLYVNDFHTASDLDNAIATLTEIRDAL